LSSERELKALAAKKDKEQLEVARRQAVESAEAIRAQRAEALKEIPPVFQIPDSLLSHVPAAATLVDWASVLKDGDAPCKLQQTDETSAFMGCEAVQKVLMNFGSAYKKTKAFQDTGSTQSPLMAKAGKDEANGFFTKAASFEEVDVGKIVPNFHDASWVYGLTPQVGKSEVLPSASGQLRVQSLGVVQIVCVQVAPFIAAARKVLGDDAVAGITIDQACKMLHNIDAKQLEAFSNAGCTFWATRHSPSEVLWLPVGTIIAYRAQAATIAHGIRKAFYQRTAQGKQNLEAVAALMKNERRDAARLDAIIALF